MRLLDPWFLALIPCILLLVLLALLRNRRGGHVRWSSLKALSCCPDSLKVKLVKGLFILRGIALCLFIFALTRPQMPIGTSKITSYGIDIILCMDVSSSMLAEDFVIGGKRVNRLQASKEVVEQFVKNRKNDRIGVVAFSGNAYLVSPLTLDYGWVIKSLDRLKIGMVEDGTAIGSALSMALNRLKKRKAKAKVIILLTDGRNNAGNISPILAAEAAKALDVKIYTIGVGKKGAVPCPFKDMFGNTVYKYISVDIDEDTLKEIAYITGGMYFRAEDTPALKEVYRQINAMEKTKAEETGYMQYKEIFWPLVLVGLFLLLLELILGFSMLRILP